MYFRGAPIAFIPLLTGYLCRFTSDIWSGAWRFGNAEWVQKKRLAYAFATVWIFVGVLFMYNSLNILKIEFSMVRITCMLIIPILLGELKCYLDVGR